VSLFDLTGTTALVTGAGKGIGRALAVGLACAGADVVLHGRHPSRVAEVADEVRATGRTATVWTVDLGDPPARITDAVRELPPVDVLVNNAGMIRRGPAVSQPFPTWREVLAVNLDAVFLLTQAVGAGMVERGSGKIIMIASLLSFQGGINVAGYAASKHAVAGLTRSLANEWGPFGVQVNAIAPGYIETDNTAPLRADPSRGSAILQRIPAGRWGRPDDLVGGAVFLASAASDYVAGHVLVVDGGWMTR
jgi:2-dehydro-3-deoxy-D-gluconate 5-dehydrogenase